MRVSGLRRAASGRRLRRAATVLAVSGLIGLLSAATADAATGSGTASAASTASAATTAVASAPAVLAAPCDPSPPTPEVPGRGVVGFFEATPNPVPPAADPFAPGSTTSIHSQYGYAGLRFNTYLGGCGLGTVTSPDASIGTTMANWIFTFPKTLVGATGALLGAAYEPKFLGVFDPLVSNVVDALRRTVFDQWAAVVVVAMGFLIVWRARRAPLASTTAAIGWALLVMVIATVLFRWPVAAGQVADRTVTVTLSSVAGGLNGHAPGGTASAGDEATASLHEALLYKAWLGGTFGDANASVAQKYGAKVFDAQALTWQQAQTIRTDPAAGQKIVDTKKAEFSAAATAVQQEDPDAYEYLVGNRSDARVGYSVLAAFAALCAVPFLIMSALLVIGALVIVRFGVMLFPAFATLGLFPTMRQLIIGIGNTLAAALLNALIFGIGSAVMVKAMGVVLDPATGLPAWLDIILVLILTVVMWAALSPFRRLTRMVSPRHDPFNAAASGFGRLGRGVARVGGRTAGAALTGFVAGRAAREHPAEVAGTPGDRLLTATSSVRPTRAEAGGPTYGSVSVPSSVLPPVPADPAPDVARGGYAVLSAGPSGTSSAPNPFADRAAGPPAPAPSRDDVPVPPTPRGWADDAPVTQGPSLAELNAASAASGRSVPSSASTVEPQDLEGEQVYVLYRPGAPNGGEVLEIVDRSETQSR